MTTKTETTGKKQAPTFYLFETIAGNSGQELKRVGAAFRHQRGDSSMGGRCSGRLCGKALDQPARGRARRIMGPV
jgi:hypothetical protein